MNYENAYYQDNPVIGRDLNEMSRSDLIDSLHTIRKILLDYEKKIVELEKINKELIDTVAKENSIRTSFSDDENNKTEKIVIISFIVSFVIGIISSGTIIGSFIFSLIISIIVFVIVYHIISFRLQENPHAESVEEAKNFHEANVVPIETKMNNMRSDLNSWTKSDPFIWATNSINENYMDYNILGYFLSYLKVGRADNLKEVINLYEEEMHRNRMEAMQQATLNAAEKAADSAEETARAAKASAVSNAESAANLRAIRKRINKL